MCSYDSLWQAMRAGGSAVHDVPDTLRQALQERAMVAAESGPMRLAPWVERGAVSGVGPETVACVYAVLERAARSLGEAERQAVQGNLAQYEGLFSASVFNAQMSQAGDVAGIHLLNNALTMALDARGVGMLATGGRDRPTVTRVAALSAHFARTGVALAEYRHKAGVALRALDVAPDVLCKVFHPDLTQAQLEHPSIRRLLSWCNCLLSASWLPKKVTLTTCDAFGGLTRAEVPAADVQQRLDEGVLRPINNGLEITVHDGAADAAIMYHVPLVRAPEFLAQAMWSTAASTQEQQSIAARLGVYEADMPAPRGPGSRKAPAGAFSSSVMSQKLALLYGLMHSGDGIAGTPSDRQLVAPQQAVGLFAKWWGQALKELRADALTLPPSDTAASAVQAAIDAELVWLGNLG